MKKIFLVALVVSLLLVLVFGLGAYFSQKTIARKQSVTYQYGDELILHNQVNEALDYTNKVLRTDLVYALLGNRCQLPNDAKGLKSRYAAFEIEGVPVSSTPQQNPDSPSGCFVKVIYGQGSAKLDSPLLRNKLLYLEFTNGGEFVIIPAKSTLDKKYWISIKK
ncbi:MAG: hypothetical protein WDW19_02675 [Neisseriaceae bacterium]